MRFAGILRFAQDDGGAACHPEGTARRIPGSACHTTATQADDEANPPPTRVFCPNPGCAGIKDGLGAGRWRDIPDGGAPNLRFCTATRPQRAFLASASSAMAKKRGSGRIAKTRHRGQSPTKRKRDIGDSHLCRVFLFSRTSTARPARMRESAGCGDVAITNGCLYNGATTASRGLPPGRCAGMRTRHLPHTAQLPARRNPITSDDPRPARLRADALRLRVVAIPGRIWSP